jgi:hypothetical protein
MRLHWGKTDKLSYLKVIKISINFDLDGAILTFEPGKQFVLLKFGHIPTNIKKRNLQLLIF